MEFQHISILLLHEGSRHIPHYAYRLTWQPATLEVLCISVCFLKAVFQFWFIFKEW